MNWDGFLRLAGIALIDAALSGDNAIVIGLAAASLPRGQRRWAIAFGGACAIALRIALTAVATLLMLIPYLAAAGGVALVFVVYKLLGVNLSADERRKSAENLGQAIVLIAVADVSMSLDNVIAVAGSAHGSVPLLVAGLFLSMPLLLTTGNAISLLVDRYRWLVYLGAFAIAFTAARMVLEDQAVKARLNAHPAAVLLLSAAAGVLIPAACWALSPKRMAARPAGPPR